MDNIDIKVERTVIDRIHEDGFSTGKIELKDSIIDLISLAGVTIEELVIENCIIKEFIGIGTWLEGGAKIRNSIFTKRFTLEAGGHNKKEVTIEGNVFYCFADFFDAHFDSNFIMTNNIFANGSNLLHNKDTPVEVRFEGGSRIEGNIGNLNFEINTIK